MKKLEPKQLRFCQEYVKDLDGMNAAIRAGYAKGSAKMQASRMLTKDNVKKEVANLQSTIEKKSEVEAVQVVLEIKKIAESNIQDYYEKMFELKDITKLPRELTACIKSIEVKYSKLGEKIVKLTLHDKVYALDMLGRHTGIFEKDNNQHPNLTQVNVYVGDNKTANAVEVLKNKLISG